MQYDVAFYGTSLTYFNLFQPLLLNRLQASSGRFVRGYNMGIDGADSGSGVSNVSIPVTSRPSIVTFEFSMNDCASDRSISRATAISNNTSIITSLKAVVSASRIFAMTMNPVINIGGDSALRTGITDYYKDLRDLATSEGIGLIDNYPAWITYGVDTTKIPDGIHPIRSAVEAVTVPTMAAAIAPLLT
jgi:lysophospholipase L1-like esterase